MLFLGFEVFSPLNQLFFKTMILIFLDHQIVLQTSNHRWCSHRTTDQFIGWVISYFLSLIFIAFYGFFTNSALGATGRPFADNFETGFRYYVHEQRSMPYLSTEGISVSPGTKVYSAISPTNVQKFIFWRENLEFLQYILLPKEMWGNCSDHWPDDLLDIVQDGAAEEEKSENKKINLKAYSEIIT